MNIEEYKITLSLDDYSTAVRIEELVGARVDPDGGSYLCELNDTFVLCPESDDSTGETFVSKENPTIRIYLKKQKILISFSEEVVVSPDGCTLKGINCFCGGHIFSHNGYSLKRIR